MREHFVEGMLKYGIPRGRVEASADIFIEVQTGKGEFPRPEEVFGRTGPYFI
jgi:hypothetical protein